MKPTESLLPSLLLAMCLAACGGSNTTPDISVNPFEPNSGYGFVSTEYQERIQEAAGNLPTQLQPAIRDITFVNGCHPWATKVIGKCAFGTFDAEGWDHDETTGHPWANTIWISSEAAKSDHLHDVLLHEAGHAFAANLLAGCHFMDNSVDSVLDLLLADFAHDQANPAELLADAFALNFSPRGEDAYTFYLDKFDFKISPQLMTRLGAAIWLCSKSVQ